jgi:hypothetical protein
MDLVREYMSYLKGKFVNKFVNKKLKPMAAMMVTANILWGC